VYYGYCFTDGIARRFPTIQRSFAT
jgi:hypothetical protein